MKPATDILRGRHATMPSTAATVGTILACADLALQRAHDYCPHAQSGQFLHWYDIAERLQVAARMIEVAE